jgi:predicted secreted protein
MKLLAVSFLAGLVLLAGCASYRAPQMGTPRQIRVYEGEEFHVTLNIDRATEHGWRLIQQPNPRVARVVSVRYEPPSAQKKRGHDVWSCEATGRGRTKIIWHYLPRGDTNHPPARVVICEVEVR